MTTWNVPSNFQFLYSRDQIAEAVKKMGVEISEWADEVWESSHTDILAIPILRGGMFFFADLVREITRSVEIAPARTWGYEATGTIKNEMQINLDGVGAKGRSVLLIDDLCDTGRTFRELTKALANIGALEVRSAVIIKRVLSEASFDPTWVGMKYHGPEWIVGYGMDDSERWRNLPNTYIIRQS